MCVKCQSDGELPAGRKAINNGLFAVHVPHPAATHRQCIYLLMRSFKDYCKGGIFYEETKNSVYRFLSRVEKHENHGGGIYAAGDYRGIGLLPPAADRLFEAWL